MALPVIVTLVGALIGNILGYTASEEGMCGVCIMEVTVCRPM
ncbi:MAG: hypothetical protein ACLVH3_09540 [Blautia obeum]